MDLEAGIWRVPAERSKSKKAMVKYLSDSAKYVLQQVGTQGKSELIFPNPQTDKPYTTITLYEAQRLMSHQDHRSTMRYAHLAPKTLQEAANAVSIIVPKLKDELKSEVSSGVVVPFQKVA